MAVIWQARLVLFSHFSAFTFTLVSLLSPAWYFEDPENKIGLWGKCHWRYGCQWMHQNRFAWEKRQPEWWIAVQVLMCCAVLTQILSFIMIFKLNRGDGFITRVFKIILLCFLILTFIEILAAVARFGVMANDQRGVVIHKESFRNFGWAYLLGIMGALMELLTIVFFAILVRKERRRQDAKANLSYGFGGYVDQPHHQQQQPYPGMQQGPGMGYAGSYA
jgi:hypothetical protein